MRGRGGGECAQRGREGRWGRTEGEAATRHDGKVKGVREPSEQENSRGLGESLRDVVFYVMAEAMTRKAEAEAEAEAEARQRHDEQARRETKRWQATALPNRREETRTVRARRTGWCGVKAGSATRKANGKSRRDEGIRLRRERREAHDPSRVNTGLRLGVVRRGRRELRRGLLFWRCVCGRRGLCRRAR